MYRGRSSEGIKEEGREGMMLGGGDGMEKGVEKI